MEEARYKIAVQHVLSKLALRRKTKNREIVNKRITDFIIRKKLASTYNSFALDIRLDQRAKWSVTFIKLNTKKSTKIQQNSEGCWSGIFSSIFSYDHYLRKD